MKRRVHVLLAVLLAISTPRLMADPARANLKVSITDSKDPVSPGEPFFYTITISNVGSEGTVGADVALTALNGLVITSVVVDGENRTDHLGGFQGRISTGDLPAGLAGTKTVRVNALAARGTGGTVFLIATASPGAAAFATDTDESDNRAVHSTTVRGPAPPPPTGGTGTAGPDLTAVDLVITVTDSKDPVRQGDLYTYTISATNAGTTPITDFLMKARGDGCKIIGEEWHFDEPVMGGALAPGQTRTFPVRVRATAAPGETARLIVNSSPDFRRHVELTEGDNRSAEQSTQIIGSHGLGSFIDPGAADVGIAARDDNDPVNDGDVFTFTVVAYNHRNFSPFTLEITPPPGITILSMSEEEAGALTCQRGESVSCKLEPGFAVITVTAQANLPAGGTVSTKFTVTPDKGDVDPSDNVRVETTTIRPKVTTTGGTGTTGTGGTGTGGTGTTGGVGTQPPTTTEPGTGTTPGTTPGTPPSGTTPPGTTTEPPVTPTPPGETGSLLPQTPPLPSTMPSTPAAQDGKLVGVTPLNSAGNLFDPSFLERYFGTSPQPTGRPDLSVGLLFDPNQVTAGTTGMAQLTLGNSGTGGATGVFLNLNLPSQLTFLSATSSRGSCTNSGNLVSCNVGSVASGENVLVHTQFRANTGTSGSASATASVTLNETDSNPSNNQATGSLNISAPAPDGADLAITGTFSPSSFVPGQNGGFNWQVRNFGPVAANNTRTTATLPANYSVQSATTNLGSCTTSGNQVTCAHGSVGNNATADIQVSGQVGSGASGTLTATGSVASDTADPNSANNQTSVNAPVQQPSAELQLSTNAPTSVATNQQFRYLHTVINGGPSPATGVVVTNTMDANATFVSCSPTCTPPGSGRVVRCTVPTLQPGSSGSVFVDVRAPATPGTLTNQTTVAGAEADSNTSNNQTTVTTTVNN